MHIKWKENEFQRINEWSNRTIWPLWRHMKHVIETMQISKTLRCSGKVLFWWKYRGGGRLHAIWNFWNHSPETPRAPSHLLAMITENIATQEYKNLSDACIENEKRNLTRILVFRFVVWSVLVLARTSLWDIPRRLWRKLRRRRFGSFLLGFWRRGDMCYTRFLPSGICTRCIVSGEWPFVWALGIKITPNCNF